MTADRRTAQELDRLCELTALGGAYASAALGDLLAEAVRANAPRVCGPTEPTPSDRFSTGILFEVEGDLAGLMAIVMSEARSRAAIGRMLGGEGAAAKLAESALRELGNIIASHTVSAIADAMGGTVLLSVPKLVMRDAGQALAAWIAERRAPLRIEIDLAVAGGEDAALLVFIPEPIKSPDL